MHGAPATRSKAAVRTGRWVPALVRRRRRPSAEDALIAGVERGVYVVDFWYTRILDPRTQVVTGLTRNGVWLIEDGRVARPIKNLRFTQSYAEALGPGAVRAVGSEAELVAGRLQQQPPGPEPPPRVVELHRAARRAEPATLTSH